MKILRGEFENSIPSKYLPRILSKVQFTETCWIWTGGKVNGYGRFRFEGKTYNPHRLIYFWLNPSSDRSLQCDHTCRNRACINPNHLELVTSAVNKSRGVSPPAINATKEFCKSGHSLGGDNLVPWRQDRNSRECYACLKFYNKEKSKQRRLKDPNKHREYSRDWARAKRLLNRKAA